MATNIGFKNTIFIKNLIRKIVFFGANINSHDYNQVECAHHIVYSNCGLANSWTQAASAAGHLLRQAIF